MSKSTRKQIYQAQSKTGASNLTRYLGQVPRLIGMSQTQPTGLKYIKPGISQRPKDWRPVPLRKLVHRLVYPVPVSTALKSQRANLLKPKINLRELLSNKYALINPIREIPGAKSACARRHIRKQVLFAIRIAGYKRSPGQGGHYRRTENSLTTCR